ncbi:putative peptidylglycine alpha-hydroxylating monooxygenase 1 [Babylonia areolata]|uniref:putative peptidylglycine alpha-hydroxylating monooxygenase 1 n=1 Tax=Babylonia areolata TaxID=304850 RepID=UPI003FD5003C
MLVFLFTVLTATGILAAPTATSVDLTMPEVQPQKPDTYLCRTFDTADLKHYITGFIPNANKDTAHHILLYGCEAPGSQKEIWNCGEMAASNSDYELGPTCAEGPQILYAWAMDAPSLSLPKDVAFKIGADTGIKKLVMQVHYKNVTSFKPPFNRKDSSGLTLITTDEPKPRLAGVYLMVTGGVIPSGQTEYLETACPFPDAEIEIHPFAFRTHTHPLGRVVSGYRVRDRQWTEIGRQDPRKPQMFYNVTTPGIKVQNGDILVARCTMENNLDHDVRIGATQNDEMCNFYIMYYTDGEKHLSNDACFSQGGPQWYLTDYPDQAGLNLPAMPATASVVPGTDKMLLPTTEGAREELMEQRQGAQEQEEEEEEEEEEEAAAAGEVESPVEDELLDEYLSQLDPDQVDDLVSEVMGEQRIPKPPYLGMPAQRQLSLNEAYGPYYYDPEDTL